MAVPIRHLFQQGPVLGAVARTAVAAARSSDEGGEVHAEPGPALSDTIPPRPRDLVDAYVRHVGGDPRAYRGVLPPHFFPQWTFPLMSRLLADLPYDLSRMLNAGASYMVHRPLPDDEPLQLTARLTEIDDNGRRVLLHQEVVTGTASAPEAHVGRLTALIPRPRPRPKGAKKKTRSGKSKPTVPTEARELATWRLPGRAGLDFALLTGDFNPIHWIPLAGRAAGFGGCILHGFGTMARASEGLVAGVLAGDAAALTGLDVRFLSPVKLPGTTRLYVHEHEVFVGPTAGAPAALAGTFTLREDPHG